VTPTSRLGPPLPPRTKARPAWHVVCFLTGVSGCYYTGPMPDWEENVPPRVLASNPPDGESIVVGPDGRQVMVVAHDPDPDDVVTLTWWFTRDGRIPDATPFEGGSTVTLPWDPALDGQDLRCLVYDDAGHDLQLSWPLEVP
jgi:hypothetical protein